MGLMEMLLNVEAYNDQFRQPNPNGSYPICKPSLGSPNHSIICCRCGMPIVDNRPCPDIPPEQRWGEDYKNAGSR